jgi:hypothetical protein
MKADKDFINQLKDLYQAYEKEVKESSKEGLLTKSTADTYLLHSGNFIKWCKGDFVPGGRNKN